MLNFAPAIPPRSDLDWCLYLRNEGFLGEALERCLHDIGVMQPGGWAEWDASKMTDTGAPVEMLFTASQSSLALRTEVENPGKDPSGRVEKVCSLISGLDGILPPPALRDLISAAQTAGPLAFGAWLGLRRYEDKLATTLFAEIPTGAADLTPLFIPDCLAATFDVLAGKTKFTMVEYDTMTGDLTLHFDTECAPNDIVPVLVKPVGSSPDPILKDIQFMRDAGAQYGQPRCDLSFSYTVHADGSAPSLTMFVSSKGLFANDDNIETRVRNHPGNHVEAYAALAGHLPPAPAGKTHHGKIGLKANGIKYPLLTLGVAAPWICLVEST